MNLVSRRQSGFFRDRRRHSLQGLPGSIEPTLFAFGVNLEARLEVEAEDVAMKRRRSFVDGGFGIQLDVVQYFQAVLQGLRTAAPTVYLSEIIGRGILEFVWSVRLHVLELVGSFFEKRPLLVNQVREMLGGGFLFFVLWTKRFSVFIS